MSFARYAVRESGNKVKLFRAFKERLTLTLPFSAEAMMGGALLGLRGNTFVCFYDWNSGSMVRRIDVIPKNVQSISTLRANIVGVLV